MAGDWAIVKLLAHDRVLAGGLVAIHGRSDRAPADTVTGLREAAQWRFQALRAWQHVRLRHAAIGERKARGHRGAHRQLAVNFGSSVAPGASLDQKASDAFIRAGPYDGHVGHRAVGDPGFLAVDDPVAA